MNILDKSLKSINMLQKTMDACWLRNEVISDNIANVNTPNFKRSEVKFESILAESLSNMTIDGKLTNKAHLSVGNSSINEIRPIVSKDMNTKYRKDGNNVNVDVEMANLAKNTIMFNTLTQRVSDNFRKLKMVIKDGR